MLFVEVMQMYSYSEVYLCNAILVTEIFCCQYSTINNSTKNNIFTKFGGLFSNLFWITCTKF